jgi:hypothetical protein
MRVLRSSLFVAATAIIAAACGPPSARADVLARNEQTKVQPLGAPDIPTFVVANIRMPNIAMSPAMVDNVANMRSIENTGLMTMYHDAIIGNSNKMLYAGIGPPEHSTNWMLRDFYAYMTSATAADTTSIAYYTSMPDRPSLGVTGSPASTKNSSNSLTANLAMSSSYATPTIKTTTMTTTEPAGYMLARQ